MRMAISPYVLLTITALGCTAAKLNNRQVESPPTEKLPINNTQNIENTIVFLTIRITQKDSAENTYSLKVTNSIVAEGQLKKNPLADFQPELQYLYCEILDANKKRTDYIRVENPLFKVYEFTREPGSNLEKKALKTTQGEFYLRFQLDKKSKYLAIYKASPIEKTLKKIYYATI